MKSVLKNKILITIIAILLLANIALLVFIVSGMPKPVGKDSEGERTTHSTASFLQTKIGFSDQQIAQFDLLKKEHRKSLNPLFEDLRKTKDGFFVLVKDSLSNAELDSLAGRIGEKQKLLDMQVYQTIREVRSLCTPQQQITFDSFLPQIAYKIVGRILRGNHKEDSSKRSH